MHRPDALIDDFMSSCPYTIERTSNITEALEKMEEYGIRHLPVVDGTKPIGIVSDRDIKRYEPFMDTTRTQIQDVMVAEPYTVKKGTAIGEVVNVMAKNKFGSAIITNNGGAVVGIFTTTDALEILAAMMS